MSRPTNLEETMERIIVEQLYTLRRSDLFRQPLVAFSAADDKRYSDLKEIIGAWHLNPAELLSDAKSVISYFVPFTKSVAMEPQRVAHGSLLWSEAYQEINKHFNRINEAVSSHLAGLGYSAVSIKPTHTYDPKDLKCMWSHRSAAAIAGLGAFAANGLLITEKGAAGRFCTVITSAELKTNRAPVENKCLFIRNGTCRLCFEVCPAKALSPAMVDKFACQDELNKNEKIMKEETALQSADTCGKCISICRFAYIE